METTLPGFIQLCFKSDAFEVERVDPTENLAVSSEEVYSTILSLEDNKSCGLDHISAEHLKYASLKLIGL